MTTFNTKRVSPISEIAKIAITAGLLILPVIFYIGSQFLSVLEIAGGLMLLTVALTSLSSFKAGLVFLVVFLPLDPLILKFVPPEIVPFYRLIPETIIYALFVSGAVKLLKKKQKNKDAETVSVNPIVSVLLIFTGVTVISILVNRVDLVIAGVGLRQIFRFILLYLAVTFYGLTRQQVLLVLGIVASLAAFESILGLIQAAVGSRADAFLGTGRDFFTGRFRVAQEIFQIRAEGSRVFATMGRYDQLGTFLALICAASLGFIYEGAKKYRNYALALLLISIPALILTYSRASWFGFLLGLIVVAVFIKKDKRVLAVILLSVITVVGYVTFREIEVRRLIDEPTVSPVHRLLEAFSTRRLRSEYTGKGRLYFIIETPKAIWPEHAIVGVGPGQYGGGAAALLHNTTAYDELNLPFGIYGIEGQIDNNWMSIFGETGLIGVTLYLLMFIMLWRFCRAVLKSDHSSTLSRVLALGLIAATAGFVFQGFLGTYFEVRTLAAYYWLLAALAVVSYNLDRNNQTLQNYENTAGK